MAKNELRLIITANGKRALDTIDATERNIKSLGSQTLKLEQDLKSGIERTAGMADAFRQMNDVVNRYAISMNELNPAISQNEAALKAWKAMMESVITKGGAFGSETLEYIKMQYASVNAEIEKLNISQNENIKALEQSNQAVTNTALSFSKYSKEVESANKVSAYFTKMLKTIPNVIGFRIVMNLIKNIGKKNLDIMFEKNPYMKEIYPGDTKEALEVFCIYEAQGEYFDISKPSNIVRETIIIGGGSFAWNGYYVEKGCNGCNLCLSVCPQKCMDISLVPVVINQKHCLHCGRCAEICPGQCIKKRG